MSFLKLLTRSGLIASTPIYKQTLIDFKSPGQLSNLLVRSDQELGGFSTAELDLDEQTGTGHFHGVLNLDLPPKRPEVVQSGYAMFRTKDQPTSWTGTSDSWNWEFCSHMLLRVKGDRRKYFINIQAESALPTDIYQHRLFLKSPGQWETVVVPMSDFILTNWGVIQEQRSMDLSGVKTVGIGLTDKRYGPFSLYIDWIKVADQTQIPEEYKKAINAQLKSPIPGNQLPID